MDYNFIRMKPHGNYISIRDTSKKIRFICFKEFKHADKCIDYLSDFRSKHGYFPSLDLTQQKNEIKSRVNFKKRTKENVKTFFEIEMLNQEDFDSLCNIYNMNIMYCYNFDIDYRRNKYDLLLTAQEIDSNPSSDNFRKMLNDML